MCLMLGLDPATTLFPGQTVKNQIILSSGNMPKVISKVAEERCDTFPVVSVDGSQGKV